MSLTSNFKYTIEIPAGSLSALLRAMLGSAEAGGLATTFVQNDVDVGGGYVVDVVAALIDSDDSPSSIELTSVDLEAKLHLNMRLEVTVQDYDGLDPLVYNTSFALPGTFVVDTTATPRMLEIAVGDLAGVDLGLVVSGGEIDLTATAFEGPVHQLYADHPEIHHFSKIKTILTLSRRVEVWLYDDAVNPITVELPNPTTLRIHMPGELKIWTTAIPSTLEGQGTFMATVDLAIEDQTVMGVRQITIDALGVDASDVTVAITWSMSPIYAAAVPTMMAGEIATSFHTFGNIVKTLPNDADIQAKIADGIRQFGSNTAWELFPLTTEGDFDLSNAVPSTVAAACLALEIEPETDPAQPADALDNFATGTKLATAIGPLETQRRLDAAADQVDALPDQSIDGYSVSLNRPDIHLENSGEHGVDGGHIWVEGSATVHVGGCVGDVDVTYHGPLTLTVSTAADGTVNFDIHAGEFGGDSDSKKDKGHWDPDAIRTYIESLDWDFPSVPSHFEGRFDLHVDFNEVSLDRRGLVIAGILSLVTLNESMSASTNRRSAAWGHDGPHPG